MDLVYFNRFFILLFNFQNYKHHYLSVILIILIGFIIDLVLGNLQNDIINNFLFLLLRILREILLSFQYVIVKYIMERAFAYSNLISLYYIPFLKSIV